MSALYLVRLPNIPGMIVGLLSRNNSQRTREEFVGRSVFNSANKCRIIVLPVNASQPFTTPA